MTTPNLPTATDGPFVLTSNPEEYAAMLQAHSWLGRVCADHRKERPHAAEADNEDDQFLYGQDFETEPEIWDSEGWEELTLDRDHIETHPF